MNTLIKTMVVMCSVVLQGCAATSLLAYKISPDYPDDRATDVLKLEGLTQSVTVTYDDWGVAHIEAQNLTDLARAAGFVQGRDRFFQMDLLRRLAKGRVSELVGEQPLMAETTVDYDRVMRGWQIEQRCAQTVSKMTPQQKELFEAFAAGANQALAKWTPLEYRLLRVEPEPWRPEDSLSIGLLNVWSISHNWSQEADRLILAASVGVERAELIYPPEAMPGGRTVATDGKGELPPSVVAELQGMFPIQGAKLASLGPNHLGVDPLQMLGASNEWVVSGEHTKSGKPMIANDPHLTHLLPSTFYPMHVKVASKGLDAIGVTMPGLPLVILGHNQKVAWAMTSSVADAIDLVLEKQDGANAVVDERGACPVTERDEVIKVHGAPDHPVKLRTSCHGPVFNDIYPGLLPESTLVSIRWKTRGIETVLDVLLDLDTSKTAADAGKLAGRLPNMYQVLAAADVDGHIGVWSSGQIPKRPNHRGTFPVPGWLAKYDLDDWVEGEQLAYSYDPPSGMLANGNNLVREPGVAGFVTEQVDSGPSYRHDRIIELLKATEKHDLASFKSIQADTQSPRSKLFRDAMVADLKGGKFDGVAQAALEQLEKWNGDATVDAVGPTLFFATYRQAVEAALADELSERGVRFFLAQRYSINAMDQWMGEATHAVWDDTRTPAKETRAEVLRAAFVKAVDGLKTQLGDDPKTWAWGRVHVMRPMHPFGSKSALDSLVNLEPTPAAGELDSVWKSHFDMGSEKTPFKPVAGPVYRLVADLGDLDHAEWVIDTGTSGWPKSPHYGDQYEQWRKGELVPMRYQMSEVRAHPHGLLTLSP